MTEARMQETPEIKPGNFCWVELGTSDSNAAKSFYSQLFGWEFQDSPMGPDMTYTMLQLGGKEVGEAIGGLLKKGENGEPSKAEKFLDKIFGK